MSKTMSNEEMLSLWLIERLGFEILPNSDSRAPEEYINDSHGTLRIVGDDHGVNDEIYTEEANYVVDFLIYENDYEKFEKAIRDLALNYKGEVLDFGSISGKFYFGDCIRASEDDTFNGEYRTYYQLSFTINFYQDAMPSDDVLVEIDGDLLKGVISVVPTFSYNKESFVTQGNLLPRFEPQSISRTIQLSCMPLSGNIASNILLKKVNKGDGCTNPINFKLKWNDVLIEGSFFVQDISLNLVKGNYGAFTCTLVEER